MRARISVMRWRATGGERVIRALNAAHHRRAAAAVSITYRVAGRAGGIEMRRQWAASAYRHGIGGKRQRAAKEYLENISGIGGVSGEK